MDQLNLDGLKHLWSRDKNIHHEPLMKKLVSLVQHCLEDPALASQLNERFDLNQLHRAVIADDFERVIEILDTDDSPVDVDDETLFGETAVCFAAYFSHLRVLEILLEKGAYIRKTVSLDSELHAAVRGRSASAVTTLLTRGAPVDLVCESFRPIHLACFNKDAAMIKLLINHNAQLNAFGCSEVWPHLPISLLFLQYDPRRGICATPLSRESEVLRALESLLYTWYKLRPHQHMELNNSNVISGYSVIGNPPIVERALVMLSPPILRLLLNFGADPSCLLTYTRQGLHDEAVMLSIHDNLQGSTQEERVERYRVCLELLLHHNVRPQHAGYINTMRAILSQLQKVPLNRKHPEMEPVFRFLINLTKEPLSLQQLARRIIRCDVGVTPDRQQARPFYHRISQYSSRLPQSLVKYCLLEDLA